MILFLFAFGALFNLVIIFVSIGLLATGGVMLAVGKKVLRTRFHLTLSTISLIIISFISLIVGLAIMIIVILPNSQAYKAFNSEKPNQEFNWIQLIKPLPKITSGGTMKFPGYKGGLNGLNLQLINNITTDNYIKQWLSLGADLQEGKLDNAKPDITLSTVLGTTLAEQGFYQGSIIPTSMLGWDITAHNPYFNVAKGWTLNKVGTKMLSVDGGPVPVYKLNMATSNNEYVGPFQETTAQFANSAPAKGFTPTGGRVGHSDQYYFPDELVNLNHYWSKVLGLVPQAKGVNQHTRAFLLSLGMNAGQGMAWWELQQAGKNIKPITDMANDLYSAMKPYGSSVAYNLSIKGTDTPTLRAGTVIMALKNGWRFDSCTEDAGAIAQIKGEAHKWLPKMGITQAQLNSWLSQKVSVPVPTYYLYGQPERLVNKDNYGMLTKTYDGKQLILSYIGLGHEMITEMVGQYEYGVLLQLNKVSGVNGADMNSYFNHIKSQNPGAWLPPTNSGGWEKVLNYPSNANPVATAVINYGMQWLRLPYSEQCRPINLPLLKRSDCSSFVWWIIDQITGKSISSAGNQAYTGNEYQMFQPIPLSQAMPGDLIFFGSPPYAHVAMVVSGNSLSSLIIINEATTKAGANVYGPSFGINYDINRFGSYQVYNLQPFYKSCSINKPAPVPKYKPIPWDTANPYMMALKAQGYGEN